MKKKGGNTLSQCLILVLLLCIFSIVCQYYVYLSSSQADNDNGDNSTSYSYLSAIADADMDAMSVRVETLQAAAKPSTDAPNRFSPKKLDVWEELDALSAGADAKDLECPHPLVPFQNVVQKPKNTNEKPNGEELIPRILHFSFKSRCLARDHARILSRWMEKLPHHSIFFHDDDAVDRLISQEWEEFPELSDAMKCIFYKGAMKIDVWRILILYKYGGIYSDIDNWPLDPFSEDTPIRYDLSGFFFTDAYDRPSQWFMASEARSPLMYISMREIISNLLGMSSLYMPRVVFVTGPHAVYHAYKTFLAGTCCNGTATNDAIVKNNVEMTGMLEKKVWKSNEGKKFIASKYDFGEEVPYNATLNVTRSERIELDSGVVHWGKVNYKSKYKLSELGLPRRMGCREYIRKIKDGSFKEIEQY